MAKKKCVPAIKSWSVEREPGGPGEAYIHTTPKAAYYIIGSKKKGYAVQAEDRPGKRWVGWVGPKGTPTNGRSLHKSPSAAVTAVNKYCSAKGLAGTKKKTASKKRKSLRGCGCG